MLDNYNINSGDDYADLIINDLKNIDGNMPEEIIEYWSIEIRTLCNINYLKYIEGELDSFLLTDEQLEGTYKTAVEKVVGDTLAGLLDNEMIEMGIDEKGEVVYSATEKGKEAIKQFP